MKTKAKKFSKKLLALLLAILMAMTCFTGAMSAFAASSDVRYTNDAVTYNELGWAKLSDEQVATALLDYADDMLGVYGPQIDALLKNALPSSGIYKYVPADRTIVVSVVGIGATIKVYTHSVDEIMETIESVNSAIGSLGGVLGDAGNLQLGATAGMRRATTSSADIIEGVLGILQQNSADYNGKDVLGEFLRGGFDLGTVGNLAKIDLYNIIGNALGMDSGYQSNLVYNIVQQLIFKYTKWYTDEEIAAFKDTANPKPFVFDNELLGKMTTELLDKISVLVTYNQQYNNLITDAEGNLIKKTNDKGEADGYKTEEDADTSATRYKEIKAEMKKLPANTENKYQQACSNLGYDPNIVYSDEFVDDDGNYLNVLLFAYGNADPNTGLATATTDKIKLGIGDNLFKFGYQALKFAWKTVLKDSLKLIHVNYDVNRGHGSNFDNEFYYYMDSTGRWTGNTATDYTMANVEAWAKHIVWVDVKDENGNVVKDADGYVQKKQVPLYESYGIKIDPNAVTDPAAEGYKDYIVPDEATAVARFIEWVKNNFEYDRTVGENSTGAWSDIDATTITNKVRYSPLADLVFNMQTGPINLYFMQTGTSHLDDFFDNQYQNYSSMVAGLNDALVAAVQDIFVNSNNVNGTVPSLDLVGSSYTEITSTEITNITKTLVDNALKVIQYTADAIDGNILKAFYDKYGVDAALTEANLEEAMIPLLVSCIGQVNLDGKLCDLIHPSDWDKCKDAEAVAYIALREYLSYILPNVDYSALVTETETEITATLDGTLLPMARDAIMYVIEAYVPVSDGNGKAFKVEANTIKNPLGTANYYAEGVNDLFTLFNSVVCYYGGEQFVNDGTGNTKNNCMGVGALLGLVDVNKTNGTAYSKISTDNTLWQNIDLAANKLLPVLGILQGNSSGNFSSYDLIWNKIVKGILDIGPNKGVTNFINQLLTIVSAEPIQTRPIVYTVYDVLAELFNALLGARYTSDTGYSQSFYPIPTRTAEMTAPFDNLLQKNTLAGTTGTDVGAIQKAICNFVEFFGFGNGGCNVYPDSMLRGVAFALQAMNTFVPEAISPIAEHTLKMGRTSLTPDTKVGLIDGAEVSTEVSFKNACLGVNTAYIESFDALGNEKTSVKQNALYTYKITDAYVECDDLGMTWAADDTNGSVPLDSMIGQTLQPGEKVAQTVINAFSSTNIDGQAITSLTYRTTVVYDVYLGTELIASNLRSLGYQVLSSSLGWADIVYSRGNQFDTKLEDDSNKNVTKELNGYKVFVSPGCMNGSNCNVQYPEYFILSNDNLGAISNYQIRLRNNGNNDRGMDGIYYYSTDTVYDDGSKSNVTLSKVNAIPVFDAETGALLKKGAYDYSTDGGKTWSSNLKSIVVTTRDQSAAKYNAGYTREELNAIYEGLSQAEKDNYLERDCVAFTLEDAVSRGFIAAYHFNENTQLYDYVYTKPSDNGVETLKDNSGFAGMNSSSKYYPYKYDYLLVTLSMRGPVDGLYSNLGKRTLTKGKSQYVTLFEYDGKTEIPAGEYPINVVLYTSSENEIGYMGTDTMPCTLIVADKSKQSSVDSTYQNLNDTLNNYRLSDFNDATAYDIAQAAATYALTAKSSPMTPAFAKETAGNQILTQATKETDSKYGDLAYVPFTGDTFTQMPASLRERCQNLKKTVNGVTYYFYDEALTMPVYSHTEVTTQDQVDDLASIGITAIKNTLDGKYYLANTAAHEYEWDNTSFAPIPDLKPLAAQKTWGEGENAKLVYDQLQFVYRDAKGDKVNSSENWVARIPDANLATVPNYTVNGENVVASATDNRGAFEKANDYLNYATDYVYDNIKPAGDVLLAEITKERQNLNENNFDITTFSKMRNVAKNAESKFSVIVTFTGEDGKNYVHEIHPDALIDYENNPNISISKIETNSTISSAQAAAYIQRFNYYRQFVVERGYLGDKLEAELVCTTNNTYDNLVLEAPATYKEVQKVDDKGNGVVDRFGNPVMETVIDTPAVVRVADTGNTAVSFGSVDSNRYIVNVNAEGKQAYTTESWNKFISAVGDALNVASRGNAAGYPERGYYRNDKTYDAAVTECYTEFKDLRIAEIALKDYVETAPPASDTITVSGKITIANTVTGGDSGNGIVGIDVMVGGTVVATSAADGTFTATVPAGTTELTIAGPTTINRTVTLAGDADITNAVIPVVICDYTGDGFVNTADLGTFVDYLGAEYYVYADLTADGYVNTADLGTFVDFLTTITYDPLVIA